jgi:hypothetical protein
MFSGVLSVFVVTLASISPEPVRSVASPMLAGIPIVINHGDTVAKLGDVSAEDRAQFPQNTVIGYKYSRFGVFWMDLWTWGGEYCLYDGNRIGPLTPEQCAALLKIDVNRLSKPWFYRFPLGLIILGGIVAILIPIGMISQAKEKREQARIKGLFEDSRYQEAIQIFGRNLPRTPDPVVPRTDVDSETEESAEIEPPPLLSTEQQQIHFDEAIDAAVDYLVHNGEDRDVAKANLHLMLAIMSHGQSQANEPA